MTKCRFVFLVVVIIIVTLVGVFLFFDQRLKRENFYYLKIDGRVYRLLTAATPEQWQKGLMNYKKKEDLKGADGMIFIFPDYDYRVFWNKDTYLDLKIYWLKDNQVVGQDSLPSILKTKNIYSVRSKEKVNKVVEIIESD
ncbi:MAG: DUF192 domain-containing protein [Patescibacteria group bacterium]|nr:DUF192 domain-containing protein [Patescibacteria group bacterium]